MPDAQGRGRGRPPVGPVVEVRLGELKPRIEAEAARVGQSQAATIRALLAEALAARDGDDMRNPAFLRGVDHGRAETRESDALHRAQS